MTSGTMETEILLHEGRRKCNWTHKLCMAMIVMMSTLSGLALKLFMDQSTVGRFGFQWTERYATLLECGERRYLLTRMDQYGIHKYIAIVRRSDDEVAHVLWNMTRAGQNPTLTCVEERPYIIGSHTNRPTVWMLPLNATQRELDVAVPFNLTGCIENFKSYCQFDSKFSLVQAGRRWLLYIRANLCPGGGCRHVQVAESHDGGRRWRPFRIVHIENVPLAANVYFFDAFLSHGGFTARFPMVNGTDAGIFETYSHNGHVWTSPVKILDAVSEGNRTHVHPVGGTHFMSINLHRHVRDVALMFNATAKDLSFFSKTMDSMHVF